MYPTHLNPLKSIHPAELTKNRLHYCFLKVFLDGIKRVYLLVCLMDCKWFLFVGFQTVTLGLS